MNRYYFLAVFSALLVAVLAAPQRPVVPIVSKSDVRDDAGQFTTQYVAGNGIVVTEQGILKLKPDGSDVFLVLKGTYGYTSPEGVRIFTSYNADENGFNPVGDHIPTLPK